MLDAARGFTAQQIAGRHGVTMNTVNTTLVRGKVALGALNIAHAVALCLAYGEYTTNDVLEDHTPRTTEPKGH